MKQRLSAYLRMLLATARSATAREAGVVMAGNLGSALLRFGLVGIVFPRLCTKSEFASFVLLMAVMDVATTFADSGLNATMVRFMAVNRGRGLRPLLRQTVMIRVSLWGLVATVGAIAAWPFLANAGMGVDARWLYGAAVFSGVLISISNHGLCVLQGLQKFASLAVLALSVNTFRVFGAAACVLLGRDETTSLFGVFFLAPLLLVPFVPWVIRRAIPREGGNETTTTYAELLRYMAPLGAVTILAIIIQRIDVFMLNELADDATVADFGLAFYVAFVFPLLTRSLFTVLLPKVSALKSAEALRQYRRRVLALYPMMLVMVVAAMAVAPWFVHLLFQGRYDSSAPILRLLILALGMHVVFNPLSAILYAVEKHGTIPLIHLLQLVLLVALNLWLIPVYGGLGAAATALVIRVIGVVIMVVLTGRAISGWERTRRESTEEDPI